MGYKQYLDIIDDSVKAIHVVDDMVFKEDYMDYLNKVNRAIEAERIPIADILEVRELAKDPSRQYVTMISYLQ